MRRITKLSIVFFIIACIYLILPFSFGMVAQRYSQQFIINENKTVGKVLGLQFNLVNYHRGWFHSTANLQIQKKMSDGSFVSQQVIPILIQHGPFYRTGKTFKTGFGMLSSENIPLPQVAYVADFYGNLGFNREYHAVLDVLSKQNANPIEVNSFKINTLVIYMTSNSDASQLSFHLDGKGLLYKNPNQSLSVASENLQSDLQAQYVGDRHWALTFGLGLNNNNITTQIPGTPPADISIHADHVGLADLHFDTQTMAKWLNEMMELKQAPDSESSQKSSAWMALFQQLLTNIIGSDTTATLEGLTVNSPMGQMMGHYDASFPSLTAGHDYFDIAMKNVGVLQLDIPQWLYASQANNTKLSVSNFHYSSFNNTVFSRHSTLSVAALAVDDNQSPSNAILNATNIDYSSELYGDSQRLSQNVNWKIAQVCLHTDCFKKIQGQLQLINMNFIAFRPIAEATRKLVQYDPTQQKSLTDRWMDVGNAYIKLVSPTTKLVVSHAMQTSQGPVILNGQVEWSGFNPSAPDLMTNFLDQSVYQLRLEFPANYLTGFIDQHALSDEAKEPALEIQFVHFLRYAIQQGYIKRDGQSYVMNAAGKGTALTINDVPWKMPAE